MADQKAKKCVSVALAVIGYADRYLVALRSADQHQGGLYEFVGGKVEADETPFLALLREVKEEIGLTLDLNRVNIVKLGRIFHDYERLSVHLSVFYVALSLEDYQDLQDIQLGQEGQALAWVRLADLVNQRYPMPKANAPILAWLALPKCLYISHDLAYFRADDGLAYAQVFSNPDSQNSLSDLNPDQPYQNSNLPANKIDPITQLNPNLHPRQNLYLPSPSDLPFNWQSHLQPNSLSNFKNTTPNQVQVDSFKTINTESTDDWQPSKKMNHKEEFKTVPHFPFLSKFSYVFYSQNSLSNLEPFLTLQSNFRRIVKEGDRAMDLEFLQNPQSDPQSDLQSDPQSHFQNSLSNLTSTLSNARLNQAKMAREVRSWVDFYAQNLPQNACFYVRLPDLTSLDYGRLCADLLVCRADLRLLLAHHHCVHCVQGEENQNQGCLGDWAWACHLTQGELMTLPFSSFSPNLPLVASCHDEASLLQANRLAKYRLDLDLPPLLAVFLSPVLPTKTHPDAKNLGWQAFADLADLADVPVIALGGLSWGDWGRARRAGAVAIAGIRGLFADGLGA